MKVKYLQWNDKIIAFLFSKTIRSSLNKSCVEYMYLQEMYNDICSNHDPGGLVGATMGDQISTLKFICTYINDIICYSSMHTS